MLLLSGFVALLRMAAPSADILSAGVNTTISRKYRVGSKMPFEEDKYHEFKGHTNMCVEDLPRWAFIKGTLRRSRRAISRTLNAFLNSNVKGTVYLGVTDEGIVKGIPVSEHQKGHMQLALDDVMGRYKPVVPKYRYKMEYVPVLGDQLIERSMMDHGSPKRCGSGRSEARSPPPLEHEKGPHEKGPCRDWSVLQRSSHKLRSPRPCWCGEETQWMMRHNIEVLHYVIEIHIFPFIPRPNVDPMILQLHPIYEDEEERAYFRGMASVYQLTHQDVAELTRRQVREHFEDVMNRYGGGKVTRRC